MLQTLRNWIRQDEADRGQRSDRSTSEQQAELTQLRTENAELRRANEILKAASAFSPRRPTRAPDGGDPVRAGTSGHFRGRAATSGAGDPEFDLLRLARTTTLSLRAAVLRCVAE